jgi:flavin reductase (DIM6/NTAB) family NADH-FMN oxidoreductase RutF
VKRTAPAGRPAKRDPTPPVSPSELRQAIGSFATGVAIVTTSVGGQISGMTVNSLTSISLGPPTVLVSLTVGARTTEAVLEAGCFAVSILSARQGHLARRFATPGVNHFTGLPVTHRLGEMPVIPGALAYLTCRVTHTHQVADHHVIVGHVDGVACRDGEPLVYMGGRFGDWTAHGSEPAPLFF